MSSVAETPANIGSGLMVKPLLDCAGNAKELSPTFRRRPLLHTQMSESAGASSSRCKSPVSGALPIISPTANCCYAVSPLLKALSLADIAGAEPLKLSVGSQQLPCSGVAEAVAATAAAAALAILGTDVTRWSAPSALPQVRLAATRPLCTGTEPYSVWYGRRSQILPQQQQTSSIEQQQRQHQQNIDNYSGRGGLNDNCSKNNNNNNNNNNSNNSNNSNKNNDDDSCSNLRTENTCNCYCDEKLTMTTASPKHQLAVRRSSLVPQAVTHGVSDPISATQQNPFAPVSSTVATALGNLAPKLSGCGGQSPLYRFPNMSFHYMMSANAPGNGPPPSQQHQPAQIKGRRKAVITVDAKTTEILIASDSVCRLFGLRDRSLIGKTLQEVFTMKHSSGYRPHIGLTNDRAAPPEAEQPIILGSDVLLDENCHLKPVYGKAVDILDANGNRSTICVWSYPLAAPKRLPQVAQRKTSAMVFRTTPSLFFNSTLPTSSSITGAKTETTNPQTQSITTASNTNNNNNNNSIITSKNAGDCYSSNNTLTTNSTNASNNNKNNNNSSAERVSPTNGFLQQNGRNNNNQKNSDDDHSDVGCCGNSTSEPRSSGVAHERSAEQRASDAEPSRSSNNNNNNNRVDGAKVRRAEMVCCQPPNTSACGSGESGDAVDGATVAAAAAAAAAATVAESIEKRAEKRIIIKNGFKRTTARLPESVSTAARQPSAIPTRLDGCLSEPSANGLSNGVTASQSRKSQPLVTILCSSDEEEDGAERRKKMAEHNSSPARSQLSPKCGGGALTRNSGDCCTGVLDESPLNRRWLLLMEPINALHIAVILGAKGRIFRIDDSLATILGYESTNRLFGTEIYRLIPQLRVGVDWDGKTQFCCGKTTRRNGVPFSIILQCDCDRDATEASSYDLTIRSISSINGVVTITDSGMLYAFNVNFLQELVGKEFQMPPPADGPLDGSMSGGASSYDIIDIIPNFYKYQEAARRKKENEETAVTAAAAASAISSSVLNGDSAEDCTAECVKCERRFSLHGDASGNAEASTSAEPLNVPQRDQSQRSSFRRRRSSIGVASNVANPTNNNANCADNNSRPEMMPGVYYGLVKHVDGSLIPVKIEVSEVNLQSQPRMFNVGIGFDRSNDYGISQMSSTSLEEDSVDVPESETASGGGTTATAPTLLRGLKYAALVSGFASTSAIDGGGKASGHEGGGFPLIVNAKFSIGSSCSVNVLRECDSDTAVEIITARAQLMNGGESSGKTIEGSLLSSMAAGSANEVAPLHTLEDENSEAVRGEYSKHYDTFQLIGNGAFGSVKLAAKKSTGFLAVTKFVCKAKVLPESWVQSPKRGNRMVPIEVHLLENLNHPNIVRVMDVFENDKYYQLVMEKLGCGMDLFEFIEFQPKLEEPLTSYIFRQIVSAVDYLHENHIVHRDLKDENVIIDQNFRCKLIDFGSAAYFGENIVFSTFCGTMEYCSPEVLTGNKYLGPELEMWSLGILLYTLVFFENPFRTAQETVQAEIDLPWDISEGLYQVLSWLLLADPKRRATVGEIKRHWWVTQKVDVKRYSFQEVLRNCDRAQMFPPKYVSDLNVSVSLGNLNSAGGLNGGGAPSASSSASPNSLSTLAQPRAANSKSSTSLIEAN